LGRKNGIITKLHISSLGSFWHRLDNEKPWQILVDSQQHHSLDIDTENVGRLKFVESVSLALYARTLN